jgi:hypothetical protein
MPMFESATGNKVKISFKGEPAIAADLKQGRRGPRHYQYRSRRRA